MKEQLHRPQGHVRIFGGSGHRRLAHEVDAVRVLHQEHVDGLAKRTAHEPTFGADQCEKPPRVLDARMSHLAWNFGDGPRWFQAATSLS